MLILLSDDHKADLAFLATAGREAWELLATTSLDFLRNGANPKQLNAIAKQLNLPNETVRKAVEGLNYLFSQSAKTLVTPIDFLDSVILLAFPDELNQLLLKHYQDNSKELRGILSKLAPGPPAYHDLQWRLDVTLASRSVRRQVTPSFVLQLDVKDDAEIHSHLLETDPANLLNLTSSLEAALAEVKTSYVRRIVRNIK